MWWLEIVLWSALGVALLLIVAAPFVLAYVVGRR
jgi:hypothetical protein